MSADPPRAGLPLSDDALDEAFGAEVAALAIADPPSTNTPAVTTPATARPARFAILFEFIDTRVTPFVVRPGRIPAPLADEDNPRATYEWAVNNLHSTWATIF
ncbi:hypothetical protein Apa02nite_055440 [Actinoplanes palleronii]|uniref:Uncharacterized protein n=1 Tax=Actinoplanes palleronii TaxID=113570 RepID=A0ABQ4BFH7_9ACTN|nr:hypothetical protein Apa02nite_055440 [Actinoplanes palleronii]